MILIYDLLYNFKYNTGILLGIINTDSCLLTINGEIYNGNFLSHWSSEPTKYWMLQLQFLSSATSNSPTPTAKKTVFVPFWKTSPTEEIKVSIEQTVRHHVLWKETNVIWVLRNSGCGMSLKMITQSQDPVSHFWKLDFHCAGYFGMLSNSQMVSIHSTQKHKC